MGINWRTASVVMVFILAVGLARPAASDTTLRYQVAQGTETTPLVVSVRSDVVRFKSGAMHGRFKWMVYRKSDNTLYAVSPEQKTVLVLNPASIARIEQWMESKRADLRERMKQMPSWKRKFMDSQVGDLLNHSAREASALRVEMTDDATQVAKVVCRMGRITVDSLEVGQLCVAPAAALDMSGEAFDAYQGLYRLIGGLQTAMTGTASDTPDIAALDGIPVRMHIKTSGITQTLQHVTHRPLPDDPFNIPQDYRRKQALDLLR